ncbi:MAG: rRNA maturation RNase YbeY [Gemmatimonadales bacterium]|nr:rRNA maturation RNase YbeY [Gemmatimonadales bacterium]
MTEGGTVSEVSPYEITVSGRLGALQHADVRAAVARVFDGEGRAVVLSVTFVGRDTMRCLNATHKDHDWPTDVLAFALTDPCGRTAGDVYVCPWIAAREARQRGLPLREELLRLVIHGALHALGYDHPDDAGRTRSPMWRRQERYVGMLA